MNGFERRTEIKKKKILNTAFELFSKYGVQKVSIQEIAKSAQVSQVTIYNYFGSKDQLLLEAVKSYGFERLKTFQELIDDSSLSFEEKIRHIITSKTTDMLNFDLDFIQTLMSNQPEIKKFANEFAQSHSIPLFMKLIEQGKEEGVVNPSLSGDMIMFYINMYNQTMRNREFFQDKQSTQQFTEDMLQLFFYGISGARA
ncbi:TetR/AcrR family transcriptional regulator [Pontibacillus sp. ALD_SL1]|uniref:TetR/AcrR family transcriptional regulator n=1 Tax=Pontibacillus sp. ALD_SL1 TaxID=2777185 RepID=UPI001A958F05|nr:TetR/AcrR family transcriptional regulator [Pontibacillus sp. ALD_SL1]QST00618.1 TetR/AcrR family transcriptional regulator [Pontibacillus sp. ALD_SL1]